jgi:hypothetical protein
MTERLMIHTLSGGASRGEMILAITVAVDEGVLADGWENMPTADILELYLSMFEEAA